MPELVQQYALYLRNIRGLSPKTVEEYCMDLRTFFRFLKSRQQAGVPFDQIPIKRSTFLISVLIKTVDVFEFMNFVADERNNMSSTRQRKSTSLKSFFSTLQFTKSF